MGRLKLLGEQEGGGTDDHSTLSNLDYAQSGHTGFVPSQGEALIDILRLNQNLIRDSGGNDRVTLSPASPHLTLTGDVKITGNVGVAGIAPSAGVALNLTPMPTPTYSSWTAFRGNPVIGYPSGATSGNIYGLDFVCSVGRGGPGSVLTKLTAIQARIALISYTGAVTLGRGLYINFPYISGGTPSMTTWEAIHVERCTRAQIGDAYGLYIEDITNNSGFSRLLEIGPDTPYLRLVGGGDPPADKSNLYLKFGSTLYRVVKSGSYMTLEAA